MISQEWKGSYTAVTPPYGDCLGLVGVDTRVLECYKSSGRQWGIPSWSVVPHPSKYGM